MKPLLWFSKSQKEKRAYGQSLQKKLNKNFNFLSNFIFLTKFIQIFCSFYFLLNKYLFNYIFIRNKFY